MELIFASVFDSWESIMASNQLLSLWYGEALEKLKMCSSGSS